MSNTAALKAPRIERYRFELLDSDEKVIGELRTVSGGYIDSSIFNTIHSGGTLALVEDEAQEIDYLNDRIKCYYEMYYDGSWISYPLGIYLLSSPNRESSSGYIARNIEIYDKLLILEQDIISASYTVASGTNVVTEVTSIITGAGETGVSIEATTEVTAAAKTWEAGTSKLRIINDLLGSINYFTLRANNAGRYTSQPYVLPAARGISWEFIDNSEGLYLPSFTQELDYYFVPNKVVLVVSNPEQTELTATATNEDASSPFSYQARGRWIVDFRTEIEATSQSVLDDKAERILAEGMQLNEGIEYQHAYIPLELHNAVTFKNSQLGISANYTIARQRTPLKAGELVRSSIRRVMTY